MSSTSSGEASYAPTAVLSDPTQTERPAQARTVSTVPSATWLLPALCFLYLLVPGHPLAILRGVPLDIWGLPLAAALAIGLYGFGLPRRSWATAALTVIVLGLVGAKLVLWSIAPTYGLAASYYSRQRVGGDPERSTEFRGASYTRVDPLPGESGFALHFFNDVERFNFYEQGQPDRLRLPFSVRWDGFLHAPSEGAYPFSLTGTGAVALWLDGTPVLTLPASSEVQVDRATVPLTAGPHAVRVEYAYVGADRPPPWLRLEWDPGTGSVPLSAPYVTVDLPEADSLSCDRLASWAARGVDAAFVAALAALFVVGRRTAHDRRPTTEDGRRSSVVGRLWLERPLLALLLAALLVHALVTTQDLYGRTIILEGGQDWLTYESYARDILISGPLMTLGKPLGQGRPFFFQPFYPYYLAGLHWLTGEGLWGPVVLQLLGIGVSGVVLYHLSKRLSGLAVACLTLVLFLLLRESQLDWVARKLLSENLYFILLPAAVLMLLRFLDERRTRHLLFGSLLLGLAAITRGPTLLYVPLAALVIAAVLKRQGAARRELAAAVGLMAVVVAGVISLVPIRNYVVSGRPALVATNAGATLLLAHTPTPKVRLSRVDENPVYNALDLDRPTREVLEFARQDPLGYAATLLPLALYTVGFSGAVPGNATIAPDILALTALYLLALALLPATRSPRAWLFHAFVAVHFVTMMTFLPYVYGYRQVLPMHLIMLPFAAALLASPLPVSVSPLRLIRRRTSPGPQPQTPSAYQGPHH